MLAWWSALPPCWCRRLFQPPPSTSRNQQLPGTAMSDEAEDDTVHVIRKNKKKRPRRDSATEVAAAPKQEKAEKKATTKKKKKCKFQKCKKSIAADASRRPSQFHVGSDFNIWRKTISSCTLGHQFIRSSVSVYRRPNFWSGSALFFLPPRLLPPLLLWFRVVLLPVLPCSCDRALPIVPLADCIDFGTMYFGTYFRWCGTLACSIGVWCCSAFNSSGCSSKYLTSCAAEQTERTHAV